MAIPPNSKVPENALVLGTQAGIPIPIDVVRPKFSRVLALLDGGEVVVMPESLNLVTVHCTSYFELTTAESIEVTEAGWVVGAFVGMPEVFYDMILPEKVTIKGSGTMTMNCLVRWAAVANEGKFQSS